MDSGDSSESSEKFVQLLTAYQSDLAGYLTALLGGSDHVQHVLQETNLVLWRKAGDFVHGTSFIAWARSVAYFQVKAFLRDRKRDRHVFFDDTLLAELAAVPELPESPAIEDVPEQIGLRHCLMALPEHHRRIISDRYVNNCSIKDLAQRWNRSQGAIKMTLFRIRQSLLECIQARLNEELAR
jgi:RNA polymerase sigma-70 factor (ECF subfamily)